jgi:endogenous inhibitor of DNA gyrase (YacG/DUF329 family)
MTEEIRARPCPRCRAPIPAQADVRYLPFCSERCKLLDFGAWTRGDYAIPATDVPAETPPTTGNA